MKNKLYFIALCSIFALLTSCVRMYYQVYDTEYTNLKEGDNSLFYDGEDLTVTYNLWGESGNGFFFIHNNTDKNIFVVLSQSFMIKNGCALDYFSNTDREVSVSSYSSVSKNEARSANASVYGYAFIGWDWYEASLSASKQKEKGVSSTFGTTETYIEKERPIICIPPKSFKMFGKYPIYENILKMEEMAQDYPKKSSMKIRFDKGNTPMHVVNRIAYSFEPDGTSPKFIDNEFWISGVKNYVEGEITKQKDVIKLRYEDIPVKTEKVFKIGSPSSFYNVYTN